MSLRLKLFLPLLLLGVLLVAYVNVSWLPQFASLVDKEYKQQLVWRLPNIAEDLAPLLRKGKRITVYRNLDSLLQNNAEWIDIELFDTKGKRIYPKQRRHPSGKSAKVYTFTQPITSSGRSLGSLVLTLDATERLAAIGNLQRNFLISFVIILLVFTVVTVITLELGVTRPVKRLWAASARLAQGDFQASLPKPGKDEVGALVRTFTSMRDAIQRYQSDLSFEATHDPLTGLFNRREFERGLLVVINVAKNQRAQHALLYIDLDQFKVINDTCGQAAGDEFMRQLGAVLHDKVRRHDTLARLGGDEFGVLLEHCPPAQALRIANELLEAIQDFRFLWEGKSFTLGASIGLVSINEHSESVSHLLSVADAACYAAKDGGRNQIYVYHDDDSTLVRRHGEMQWVSQITEAVEQGRLHLYYQLIVPVGERPDEGVHFELLLRMEDTEGNIIPPDAFLHAAERYNLMLGLDRWVTQNAFRWLDDHPEQLCRLKLCTINLSGHSLGDADFMQFVVQQFNSIKIPPEKVCFEITETAAIGNLMKAIRFMSILKSLGCRFSLDDFGTGMSSFAYLKNLPVDYLKIDGIFVKGIADDPIDYAMVKAINEIGHAMGKETIAEFVETDAILSKLREIGVDYAQGYHIAKPRPLVEMDSAFILQHFRLAKGGAG